MIKAIAFDAFGTICDVAERKRPFISLFERLGTQDLEEVISDTLRGGHKLQEDALFQIELEEELASFFEYSDVDAVLTRLRQRGWKIGIISNLSKHYTDAVINQFQARVDCLCLSCEIGYIKPEPEIYQQFCDALEVQPKEILMVGDSIECDVIGPSQCGMQAKLLSRKNRGHFSSHDLTELISQLELAG